MAMEKQTSSLLYILKKMEKNLTLNLCLFKLLQIVTSVGSHRKFPIHKNVKPEKVDPFIQLKKIQHVSMKYGVAQTSC